MNVCKTSGNFSHNECCVDCMLKDKEKYIENKMMTKAELILVHLTRRNQMYGKIWRKRYDIHLMHGQDNHCPDITW